MYNDKIAGLVYVLVWLNACAAGGAEDVRYVECKDPPDGGYVGAWTRCEAAAALPSKISNCIDYCALRGSCCAENCIAETLFGSGERHTSDIDACEEDWTMFTGDRTIPMAFINGCAESLRLSETGHFDSTMYFKCCCTE